MNNVNLIGRLTSDPDMRTTTADTPVAVLRLAVPRQRGGQDAGAVFVNVVCFGRQAEVAGEHLHKGRRVSVEGRLDRREWTNANGEARSRHEVVARRVDFLDAPPRPTDMPATEG